MKAGVQTDFKRFQKELSEKGYPQPVWRVMTEAKAREIHGRFLFTDGGQWHIPPLNTIVKGTVDEILASEKTRRDFEAWWAGARDMLSVTPKSSGESV